jgi:hypothetical protein
MVVDRMMSRKRFFFLSITFIWVFISIVFINVIDKPNDYNESIIAIGNNKKISYKIFYTPLRWMDVSSFVDISSKNNICNNYIKKGVINLKYEHEKKLYTVDKYGSFDIDAKFKYRDSIKVILEAKKDIGQCEFYVYVYPGKFNILLTGIIFFWLPLFLVYANVFLPIIRYFRKNKVSKA